jgi:SAM-dependent methyltransferase
MLSIDTNSQVKSLFTNVDSNSEFEVIFNNYKTDNKLPITQFMNLLYYVKYLANKDDLKLISETSLDLCYNQSYINTYRITINGIEKINNILNTVYQMKNNIIFSTLVSQFTNSPDVEFINKIKDNKTMVNMDNYNIRIRLNKENPIDSKTINNLSNLQYTESEKIVFRYKQRMSLFFFDDAKKGKLRLDLTIINCANTIDALKNIEKDYEVELEYMLGSAKPNIGTLVEISYCVKLIKQVLDNSKEIISSEEIDNVLKSYKKLVYNTEVNPLYSLYTMQTVSTEVQHIVDKIPNKYSVTDKIDGEKFQLFVYNNCIYFISSNLIVKKTQYKVSNINNTLLEGEYYKLENKNTYLFMIFDCLYYNGKDIKQEVLFVNRLKYIHDFVALMGVKEYLIKPFTDKFDVINQEQHYYNEMYKYHNNLNKLIDISSDNDIIFHTKMILFPLGGNNCEVFSFCNLIWNGSVMGDNINKDRKINCPYILDGIIFTGIEQKYVREKKEHKYPIYKYKPPLTNSIDVYITFQRNLETGEYLNIYDNTISNNIFRITNLYVGDVVNGNKEIPVPFMKEENNHEAFFLLDNNHVRDVDGNLVNDNTVVEIIYTNDMSIPHQYGWKILRTRWDKTESVLRDKKRYGNYKEWAMKIWKSIKESVTINEIQKLSRPDTYLIQQKILSNRIDTKIIASERAQDIYYQRITNLGKIFRDFHNWIKSIIIYTYCEGIKDYTTGKIKKKTVLDIGCGRGGDIEKWYHARVGELVAVDPDYEGLYGAIDSFNVRYQKSVSKYPDFTKMTFFQASGNTEFNSEKQLKIISTMSQNNKNLIDKIFIPSRSFDIFSFQFSIHYLFDNNISLTNLVYNIKTYLKDDGYIICTTTDSVQIMKLLAGKDTYTSWYTDEEGQRRKFFEIIKKFDGDITNTTGHAIDIHMSWVSQEGVYLTEFMVPSTLLIHTMEKANCVLVDTDLFVNIYNMNKDWFLNVIDHEENPKNKKFYKKVAEFYKDLKGADRESKIWNDIFRFYVFKKVKLD